DLGRLEAVAAVGNAASRRVLEKADFRAEGVARGLLVIGGKRVDHVRYGLLRDEWAAGGGQTADGDEADVGAPTAGRDGAEGR
ncbi:MAG: GNAT family N-acetyltransferase, partial [Chloroflexota bacterium]|nr:GNAT family N-acetyltransferase [Chloroflexota bacterium]